MQDESTPPFALDERLERDTRPLVRLELCEVRLMDDRRWPWLLLVPHRAGTVEITDLRSAERALLMEEAARCAAILKAETGCAKTNVATIGNIVAQFHLHVVARRPDDPNWPGPVWGFGQREPWRDADTLPRRLQERLS